MKDIRQRAFVGFIGLAAAGLLSMGCSSSSSSGTGGTSGSTGGTTGSGGTQNGTGGSSNGTGGSAGGGGSALPGCASADAPGMATIADFSGDAGIEVTGGGIFIYPGSVTSPGAGAPMFAVTGGGLHITNTVTQTASAQYVGAGIYFSGNTSGSDCVDAHTFTGVKFDMKGSLTGTGCTLQFSTNDAEHTAMSSSDPKAGGAAGSYSPQKQIASLLTSAGMTVMVAFNDSSLGTGSPSTPIDPARLEAVQWQLSVPAAGAGDAGAAQCVLDMTIDNVAFY